MKGVSRASGEYSLRYMSSPWTTDAHLTRDCTSVLYKPSHRTKIFRDMSTRTDSHIPSNVVSRICKSHANIIIARDANFGPVGLTKFRIPAQAFEVTADDPEPVETREGRWVSWNNPVKRANLASFELLSPTLAGKAPPSKRNSYEISHAGLVSDIGSMIALLQEDTLPQSGSLLEGLRVEPLQLLPSDPG